MVEPLRYVSRSEEDTARLARGLAEAAGKPGAVITLDGDLGAGKTAFSRHFAAAIGVEDPVNSPTFTIIKEYEGRTPEGGPLMLYHMDVYRIGEDEAAELGLDEYFYGGGVTLIEWADRIAGLLPDGRLSIRIEGSGEGERVFRITPHGAAAEEVCTRLKRSGLIP